MTLNEAIAHAREQGEKANCKKCKLEHLQLAEWLEDYKQLKCRKFDVNEWQTFLSALRYSFCTFTGTFMNISKVIACNANRFEEWQLEQMIKEVEEAESAYDGVNEYLTKWARENALEIARFKEALRKEIEARGAANYK